MRIVWRRLMGVVVATGALALALPGVSDAASTFAWGPEALGVEDPAAYGGRVTSPAPQPLKEVSSVAGGAAFGLAIAGGTVYSWGQSVNGALGNGTTAPSPTPGVVPGLGGATEVAAAMSGSGFALMADGTVEAWGNNSSGQLGQGSHSGPETCNSVACSKVPIPVPGLSHVRAISAGGSQVLALLEDGTVEAWGGNGFGQIGDGTTERKDSPVVVGGLSEVVAVSAGGTSSFALLANGEVRAWGNGESGQLGNGATASSAIPVAVSGLAEATGIAAGEHHALALLANGEVRSWGENNRGQLGNATFVKSDLPVAVSGLAGVSAIAAGAEHSLALVGGEVESWGSNWEGQLGNGYRQEGGGPFQSLNTPVHVACGLKGITAIAAGRAQSYAWGAEQETCPGLAGLAPKEGPTEGGTEVTITGTDFGSASAVTFGSTPASSFTVESPGVIKATAPAAGEVAVDVRVTNARGTSVTTTLDHYLYTGVPTVTQVSPSFSVAGAEVLISGTNLSTVTSVHFGAAAATKVELSGSHSLRATAPAGEGVVDVTVTNPTGTSAIGPADQFMYRTVYEFGRCVKTQESKSAAADKGCPNDLGFSGPYQWFPAAFGSRPLEHPGVALGPGSITIETASKTKIACSAVKGSGSISAYDEIDSAGLMLTGCSSPKLGTCASSGSAPGEVLTRPLSALLGRIEESELPGLRIGPATGEELAQMTCGSHDVLVTGSFAGQYGKAGKMLTAQKLSSTEHKGVPAVTRLVNRPAAAAAIVLDGGPPQSAGVKLKLGVTSEEAIEIR